MKALLFIAIFTHSLLSFADAPAGVIIFGDEHKQEFLKVEFTDKWTTFYHCQADRVCNEVIGWQQIPNKQIFEARDEIKSDLRNYSVQKYASTVAAILLPGYAARRGILYFAKKYAGKKVQKSKAVHHYANVSFAATGSITGALTYLLFEFRLDDQYDEKYEAIDEVASYIKIGNREAQLIAVPSISLLLNDLKTVLIEMESFDED